MFCLPCNTKAGGCSRPTLGHKTHSMNTTGQQRAVKRPQIKESISPSPPGGNTGVQRQVVRGTRSRQLLFPGECLESARDLASAPNSSHGPCRVHWKMLPHHKKCNLRIFCYGNSSTFLLQTGAVLTLTRGACCSRPGQAGRLLGTFRDQPYANSSSGPKALVWSRPEVAARH